MKDARKDRFIVSGKLREVRFDLSWRTMKGFSVETALELRSEGTIGICWPREGGEGECFPNGRCDVCNDSTVRRKMAS